MRRLYARFATDLAARLWMQRGRLALWLPVAMAGGNAAYFTLSCEPGMGWVMFLAMVALLGAGLVRWRGDLLRVRLGAGLSCAAVCGFLAAWVAAHHAAPFPDLPHRATHMRGQIIAVEDVAAPDGGTRRRVDLAHVRLLDGIDIGMPPMRRMIRLRLRDGDMQTLSPGMWITVRALLRPPMPPDLPGGYDAQRRAWFAGIGGSARALDVAVMTAGTAGAWSVRLGRVRARIAQRVMDVLPDQRGAMAVTLLTGGSGGLSARTRADFADSGLAHLLAVAGLHIGIVMGLGIAVVRFVLALSERASLWWPCRQVAAVAGLVLGCGYVLLTGAHLPAQRGLVMAAVATLAILTGRRVLSLRSLALAMGGMLLLEPGEMLELPMQMSAAAVMALVAGFEVCAVPLRLLRDGEYAWQRMIGRVGHLSLASLLAGLACLPVGMAHFADVGAWFVLANLIAVPLAALWIMPCAMGALVLMPVGLDALALVPMGWGNAVVIWLAHHVAAWPGAHVGVPQMPMWGLGLYFAGLCWLCLWTRPTWRICGVMPIAIAMMTPWMVRAPDVIIPAQGRMLAVVDGPRLLVGPKGHVDSFVLRDWVRVLDRRAVIVDDDMTTPDGRLTCQAGMCVLARGGHRIMMRLRDGTAAASCAGMDGVVILSGALRAVGQGACTDVTPVDYLTLWRSGAQALYLTSHHGVVVRSDRQVRGARPWVMGPGQHGTPNLPMAQAE
ncbi:ComEC/Rec2 family competence protein [Novacetimonas hansenii]|uniref:ComEC/Rec2 family competence protein n=1 Tax=Novacetimonas hansenii TaxID=436 RepID=UPI001E4750B7|nr:ComEC/Rec2 family competence protein [Novacetimonas hansenii]WEQ58809.1 ComEC/Rec2 family competence protein [Novacetimonas hansenii]